MIAGPLGAFDDQRLGFSVFFAEEECDCRLLDAFRFDPQITQWIEPFLQPAADDLEVVHFVCAKTTGLRKERKA
jgi:hypothetical protein